MLFLDLIDSYFVYILGLWVPDCGLLWACRFFFDSLTKRDPLEPLSISAAIWARLSLFSSTSDLRMTWGSICGGFKSEFSCRKLFSFCDCCDWSMSFRTRTDWTICSNLCTFSFIYAIYSCCCSIIWSFLTISCFRNSFSLRNCFIRRSYS